MSAAIRAGRAFVELFIKDLEFNKSLDNAKAKLNAWKASLQSIGVAALGIGTAMVTPFAMATKAAGDLAETMNKLKILFDEAPEAAVAWVDSFSGAVGRSKKESADALSAFQAMFVGMGMTQQAAGELAKEFTALAIDFGSFHNLSDPEAIERFISAFAGSSQVLDMFGINIKQSALDIKLLEMGFETCQAGATELQKILARAEIIRETMGKQGAIGDAIRTAESFSNQFKRLRGDIMNFAAEVGSMVMPIFQQLMQWFNVGLGVIRKWLEEHKEVAPFVLKAALAIGTFGAAMLALSGVITVVLATGKAFVFLASALKAVHTFLLWPVTPWGALFKGIAVVTALAYAFGFLDKSVGKVSRAMEEQAEANQKARTEDEGLMNRLQQLSEKQSLSNDESREAATIIEMLQAKYGTLGLSIDSATGKIEGMTEAQKKLAAAMKAQEMQDLQNSIDEARANADVKNAELRKWDKGNWNWETSSQETVDENRKRILAERQAEYNRMRSAQARLDAMKAAEAGDGKPDISAAEIEKRAAAERKAQDEQKKAREKAIEDSKEAAEDLAKIEDDRRRESLTPLEREIEDAQRRGDERERLAAAVLEGERQRSVMDGDNNMIAQQEFWDRQEQIKAETEADIAAIRQKAAEEEAKKEEDARRGQLDEIARKELEIKYAAKAGETQEQAAQREHEKRMALIELERKQALDNLNEGLDPNLVNQDFDLQKRLAEAEFNARGVGKAEQKMELMGSFSAASIGRFAASRVQDQQLAVQMQMKDELVKLNGKEGGIPVGGDNE